MSNKAGIKIARLLFVRGLVMSFSASVNAQLEQQSSESPWLAMPTLSSDPKVGTSIGAMGIYIHRFDESSPSSMFGLIGSYSNTDSYTYGAFGRSYFDDGNQRLSGALINGKIRNEYSDFLGSGLPVQSTDYLNVIALRYYHRVSGQWYVGPQLISTNYAISGDDWLSGEILEQLGLTGFDSNGLGLAVAYDSRDNQNSASEGMVFEFNNVAYRKSFGGDTSFDAYNGKFAAYRLHGNGHVLAMRAEGRWTNNAPSSGYSSVTLRGYTRGQYLAPHMTMIEAEERYSLAKRWTLNGFGGLAYLYGEDPYGEGSSDWFPAVGAGIGYTIKPQEKMVIRADVAIGKSGNKGFYFKFGQPF